MATAELKTKATMDSTAFAKGAEEVKEKAREMGKSVAASNKPALNAAEELRNKNREVMKQYIQMLSPIIVLTSMITKIASSISDYNKRGAELEKNAKGLKISAEYYATVEARARAAGLSADQFSEAMKRVAEGKDSLSALEQQWNATADGIKTASNAMENFEAIYTKRILGGKSIGEIISSKVMFAADFWTGGKAATEAKARTVVQGGNYTLDDVSSVMQTIGGREGDDIIVRRVIEEVERDRQSLMEGDAQRIQTAREETMRGYVKEAGGDIGMAYQAYSQAAGDKAISRNAFQFAVEESTTEQKRFTETLKELKDAADAQKKEIEEKTKKDEEFRKWAEENRRKGTELLKKEQDAIAKENESFAEATAKVFGALPSSFGFNAAGGDIIGRERSTYNATAAKADRDIRLAEMSEDHLKRIKEIMEGE